jgi:hypothetical protein
MKTKMHHDVWIGLFIIVICVPFLVATRGKPADSMTFPTILLVILALMALVVALDGVRKTKRARGEKAKNSPFQTYKLKTEFIAFLFIAAYVALFWLFGYFTATILFLPAMMTRFGMRKPKQIGFVTLGFAIFAYVLFVRQLSVPVLDFGYVERILLNY